MQLAGAHADVGVLGRLLAPPGSRRSRSRRPLHLPQAHVRRPAGSASRTGRRPRIRTGPRRRDARAGRCRRPAGPSSRPAGRRSTRACRRRSRRSRIGRPDQPVAARLERTQQRVEPGPLEDPRIAFRRAHFRCCAQRGSRRVRSPCPALPSSVASRSATSRHQRGPVDPDQRHEAREHRDLEGDPERRSQRPGDHRAEAVLRGRCTGDVDRVRDEPAREERRRERDERHRQDARRDEQLGRGHGRKRKQGETRGGTAGTTDSGRRLSRMIRPAGPPTVNAMSKRTTNTVPARPAGPPTCLETAVGIPGAQIGCVP